MQLLTYILLFPILWLISLLPFGILYLISDIVSFIIFHFIGYRKKIVLDNLKLAFEAGKSEGNSPCILNASNEIVVDAFLKEKIAFLDMTKFIEESLNKISYIANPNLEELIETDLKTRNFTKKLINTL